MGELQEHSNIGVKLEKQLNAVGIFTFEQLVVKGSKEAWLLIKRIDSSACYMRLCALEGAIRGMRWHLLTDEVKEDLRNFYKQYKNI